ncbi:unnamed protein product [Eruca vesicaria subsp. sativa]|uniref:Uncharacterized protein n=1 Tax=Eruca vesicaria subsp. sativa TaxID=29727 RepID=A0ABC8LNE3_ERUVS|nr:unnamed protein product [Eruca vesicaria subsp. sativa]
MSKLHGRDPKVVHEMKPQLIILVIIMQLPPLCPELSFIQDGSSFFQMLEIKVKPKVLPFLVLCRGSVERRQTEGQIHDESPVQILSFTKGTQETPKKVVHALTPITPTNINQVVGALKGLVRLNHRKRIIDRFTNHRQREIISLAITLLKPSFLIPLPLPSIQTRMILSNTHHSKSTIVRLFNNKPSIVLIKRSGLPILRPITPSHITRTHTFTNGRLTKLVKVNVFKPLNGSFHHEMENVRVFAINGEARIAIDLVTFNLVGRGFHVGDVDERSEGGLVNGHEIFAGFDDGVVGSQGGVGSGCEESGDLVGRVEERVFGLVSSGDDGEDEYAQDEEGEAYVSD